MTSSFSVSLVAVFVFVSGVASGRNFLLYRPELHGALASASVISFSPLDLSRYNRADGQASADTDSVVVVPPESRYPARGMVLSLAVPGAGEWYAGAKWKTLAFATFELTAWVVKFQLDRRANDRRIKLEEFADEHWDVYQWWLRSPLLTQRYPDVTCNGTHRLGILLDDGNVVSSDTLCTGWIDGAQVVRNGEFYENIGKYDQFVAGWDDLYDENGKEGWWEEQKSVGDSVEVLVMTERRNRYLDMRQEHNRILQIAGYAVTSILFNHVISAMDAFLETRRRSGPLKELNASASLRFSPQTPHGVGGVSLTLSW